METRDAISLIADAIPASDAQVWADFGAGDGTFTRALIELLGPRSHVYAVDRDARALEAIQKWPSVVRRNVTTVVADLSEPLDIAQLGGELLDGALFANSLHFMRDASGVLSKLGSLVKPSGRIVIVEYDGRAASRWVPYPIPSARVAGIAESAGLSRPVITARRASAYGGEFYVAAADRLR